jgi:hypothetical protein
MIIYIDIDPMQMWLNICIDWVINGVCVSLSA